MVERRIDMTYLVFCWQDDSPDNAYYLDLRTGVIKLVNRHLLDLRELTDEIEKERERYLYLPKPDRQTQLQDLRDFAESVPSEHTRRILRVAFESPHVLSAFRKILDRDDGQAARLHDFLEERVTKRIEQWLKANAVPQSWEVTEEQLAEEDEEYEWEDFSV